MQARQKNAFTLVELMVVAIIVAILAAVAIPLMSGNVQRAIATEATSALGMIRSNLRAMKAETGDYTVKPGGEDLAAGPVAGEVPDIVEDDLDGHYFSHHCYEIELTDLDDARGADYTGPAHEVRIVAYGADSEPDFSPGAAKVADITYSMFEDGTIEKSTDGGTTWVNVQ